MLLTFAPLVAGLSGLHELALALVAAAFIVFALVSSFVLPRWNPNFPGGGIKVYVVVVVLFFVAMMAAVLIFGKEHSEAARGSESPATTTQATSTPSTTASAPSGGAPATTGDATAGKQVFASAGCAGCHTLKAAGASGTVGPNLDQLKPAEATVAHQVEVGGGPMPAFKGQLSPTQIQDVAAFVFASTH